MNYEEMKASMLIVKTRQYLDYLENHLRNVAKAFSEFANAMANHSIIYDDFNYHALRSKIEHHDVSKLSEYEFTQYRDAFYPVEEKDESAEIKMEKAWEHHKGNNDHHIERIPEEYTHSGHIALAHMFIDWLAMSYVFKNTPRDFYEKNHKEDNPLPEWAEKIFYSYCDTMDRWADYCEPLGTCPKCGEVLRGAPICSKHGEMK